MAASPTCEDEVVAQLRDLYQQADQYVRRDGFVAEDEFFYAEQNARLVQHAEEYYRCLSVIDTWPIRLTPSWPIWDVMVARRGFRCGPTIRISAMRGRRPWGDGANGTWGN